MKRKGIGGYAFMFRMLFIVVSVLLIAGFLYLLFRGSVRGYTGTTLMLLGCALNIHLAAFFGYYGKKRAWVYGAAASLIVFIFLFTLNL
ncbi:MAG: hypothetical protein Q4B15_05275 [Lachnospiraceae bacterium]|nr:hypothetical protein [Lachnospiraceae bacterium]